MRVELECVYVEERGPYGAGFMKSDVRFGGMNYMTTGFHIDLVTFTFLMPVVKIACLDSCM